MRLSKKQRETVETLVELKDLREKLRLAEHHGEHAKRQAEEFKQRTTELTVELDKARSVRRRMPLERQSLTHKFSVAGHKGYLTCGLYDDGSLGEIFVRMAKEGSTIAGLMDSFGIVTSLALQHGVSLRLLVDKFRSTRFEPYGVTENEAIREVTSIMDYIFRYLEMRFLPAESK